jgi:predicted nucleotidyltransferase
MPLPKPWADGIRQWAERTGCIREVWLFGSRARGDHEENSDVDLALALMPPIRQGLGRIPTDWALVIYNETETRTGWKAELKPLIGREVDFSLLCAQTEPRELIWRRDGA